MEIVDPSLTTLRVWITTFHAIAVSLTLFRLYYRFSTHRWWYEDWFAFAGLLAEVDSVISVWIFTYPWTASNAGGRVIAYWNVLFCFTICIWSSRLSIIFSIIRLSFHVRRVKHVAIWTAVAFTMCSGALLAIKSTVCTRNEAWTHLHSLSCHFGPSVGIIQIAANLLSSISLVTLPILLLRRVELSRERKILILSVFSSSVVNFFICIVHVIFMWESSRNLQIITAQVEIATSLIVCDLLVIVAYFHHVFGREDLESAQDSDYELPNTVNLTTMVDFGYHSSCLSHGLSGSSGNDTSGDV